MKAIDYMEKIAKDNSHGYDQTHRDGKPDFDCSSLVIKALKKEGYNIKATYTGDLEKGLKNIGMTNVTKKVSLKTGVGLKRGDILLKPNSHVAMFCGDGKMVDARINEKGSARGGKEGDQTGKEIMIHAYKNHPFTLVYRFVENTVKTEGLRYYKKCSKDENSIVDALKEIGIDSSLAKRKRIAKKNGIKTDDVFNMNLKLLSLLKKGELIRL